MPNSSAPQTGPKGERAEALPANLRRLRLEAQLTLDRLGALSGVSRAMISKIERGASVPTATVLGKLAAALQVSLSQLLGIPCAPAQAAWQGAPGGLSRPRFRL